MTFIGPPPAAPVAPGPYEGTVTLLTDVHDGRYGSWAIGAIDSFPVLVESDVVAGRGDVLEVSGTLRDKPGEAAGRAYGGILDVHSVIASRKSGFLPHVVGGRIRETVVTRLQPLEEGRALLAGFLIGDTSGIDDADIDAMRRSGLAHFVAVSGSNVALFLGLLAVAAGPLALGPRRRAIAGLIGLPLYAAATRFEPSVMRASVMAGLALAGRLLGVVLEAWQLLALAVATLAIVDPGLVSNVGFQLSVAATTGVLVGARWPVRGKIARALTITVGAQLAVAPLLLFHFGTVPLLSPVVNLVAAPLVTSATVVGAVGVAGLEVLVTPAVWLSALVLGLARGAAGWPQMSAGPLVLILVGIVILSRFPRSRVVAAGAGALVLTFLLVAPTASLPPGSIAVLDVGQGDAILLHGGDGRYALVDGGPDPAVLVDRLRHYGVSTLELTVLTHVHADHVTGVSGIVDLVTLGTVWANTEPHTSPAYRALVEALSARGISVSQPDQGDVVHFGELIIRVEGPVRRYASPNDQSIVLSVGGPARSMLLAGDIETFAQADLVHLRADVLKVPHQGAGTSDADWLRAVGSEVAVISVGPNQFGHPVDWVIDTLRDSGATVMRTDWAGDVIVDLRSEASP